MQQLSILTAAVAAVVPKGSAAALSAAALSPAGQFAVAINAAQAQISGVAGGPVAIRSIGPQPAGNPPPAGVAVATQPVAAIAPGPAAVIATVPTAAAGLAVPSATIPPPAVAAAAVVIAGPSAPASLPARVAARSIQPQPAGIAAIARPAVATAGGTAVTAAAPAVATATASQPAGQPAPLPPDTGPPSLLVPASDPALPMPPALAAGVAVTLPAAAAPPSAVPAARPGDAKTGKSHAPAAAPAPPVATATVADAAPAIAAPQANAAVVPAPVEAHPKTVSAGSGPTTSVDAPGADPRAAVAHAQSTQDDNPPAAVGLGGSAVPLPDPVAAATVASGLTAFSAAPSAVVQPTRTDSVADSRAVVAPTQQIAAGLQALSRTTEGNLQLVVRLDPPDLGRVQIAIAQPKDGPANVVLMVERPETLLLVLRDQAGLHQALDRAGVAAEGRTIDIQLAPTPAGQGQSGGAALDLAREQGGRSERPEAGATADNDPEVSGRLLRLDPRQTWSRVGIDITA